MRTFEPDDVWAVIPARHASSRFPGKPLAPIHGVPLVVRVYGRVAAALPPERIAVATDDARIEKVCRAHGIRCVMTSPSCITGTDRVWEAAQQLDAAIVVNVQGDEPLVSTDDIRAALEAKRARPDVVVNTMCRITSSADLENSNVPKVVVNERGELVYMSRAPVPFHKDKSAPVAHFRQVCIYVFSKQELQRFASHGRKTKLEAPEDIEILRFLDLGIPVQMIEVPHYSVAVDEPDDIARVEELLKLEGA
jgi:3-deoxy-manno-octulosonate cytidylyltransferase (CMP-KDO synthetase)